MGVIYDRTKGRTDSPHRHSYYTVLFIEEARGKHIVDYKTYPFKGPEVHFVYPGQVHQVDLRARPEGWVFTFSRDFLGENNIPENFITNIDLFKPFDDSPPLQIDEPTHQRLKRMIQEMEACIPEELTYRKRALGALLQLFLIYCNNSTSVQASQLDEKSPGICILRDFKQLVETRHTRWHKVQDYAAELHLSAKHISQTVKGLTGKSAKEFIQDRLLLEAKRLLLHTNLSVKEVAYQLGFEEPLHFSGFFKKKAGLSPSRFRQHQRP